MDERFFLLMCCKNYQKSINFTAWKKTRESYSLITSAYWRV